MAKFHAKNSYISFEDSTAASRAFHPDAGTIDWNESADKNPEISSFGDFSVQRAASALWDHKGSLDGFGNWGANANLATLQGLKGVPSVVVFAPGGSTSGCPKWSACILFTDWAMNGVVKDVWKLKCSWELRSGSVTYGTMP